MNIEEVDKKKMEALQFLADTNVKIGEARGLLVKLKEEEEAYLSDREKKVLGRIEALIDRSQQLLSEASGNFDKVKDLYDSVSSFVELLQKAHDGLSALIEAAEKKFALEETRLRAIEESLAQREQQVKADYVRIQNWTDGLNRREANLLKDIRKLESDRGAFERSIKRISKENI